MFTEKKKTAPLKYFKLRLWKRESGQLWLPFEHEKIDEFSRVKPNEKTSISGYLKWISSSVFALVPTLFSDQIHLICVNYTDQHPPENSYVTVSGFAKFDKLKPQQYLSGSTTYDGTLTVEVFDLINAKPNLELPKVNLTYKEFKLDLTRRIEGLEPQIKEFLAFTTISTPKFYENAGGINLTLYDSTKSGLPNIITREIERIIPEDLGNLHTITTEFGRFAMRYKYAFVSEDADKPLSMQTEDLLVHKTSRFMPECTEASISLFSSKDKPKTIKDPPCSLSDIPTVVPENASVNRSVSGIDQFDALKFIMVNHMKVPVVEDIIASQKIAVEGLEKLVDSYGLDQAHLSEFGFLNASYNARPSSIIRESLSYARAQNIGTLNSEQVSKVFDEYFKWNFNYVYEVWEDLLAKPITNKETLASMKVKYRDIIRIIRKYHSTGSLGARKEDIISEAKTKPFETEVLINDCLKKGIIYEPTPGIYKLTYG